MCKRMDLNTNSGYLFKADCTHKYKRFSTQLLIIYVYISLNFKVYFSKQFFFQLLIDS